MNEQEIVATIRAVLGRIAPEADLDDVAPDENLQEALDLDSMDFLNFVIGLRDATGVEIPESDYPSIATLGGCVGYLASRTAPS